jgi:triphosphatase
METEIELKFFVLPEFSNILQSKIADAKILQQSSKNLGNIYFDTPNQLLRKHDIGFRIRRFDNVYVQTLKTSGRVVAGLHQRPEYNAEHDSNHPNVSLHPIEAWPEQINLSQLQQELEPLFSTNFVRQQWLIAMPDGSHIELAFDQGEVIAGEDVALICEVELELKSGQTDALFTLARTLSEEGGMRLGNQSKAAKGYRLAGGQLSDEIKSLSTVKILPSDSVEACFIASLEHALAHWHYHEQIYIERSGAQALQEICTAISFIRQILTAFSDVIPRRASAVIRQELKWLNEEFTWLDQAKYITALTEDKGQPLRRLDAQKQIVSNLSTQFENLPDREDCLALLQSSRYCGLLLDMSRWILTKGWQPFLDHPAKEIMETPIEGYSKELLNNTWQQLLDAFPVGSSLHCEDYVVQKSCLSRNLMTGICFADIYEEDRRSKFRMPWEDLLAGIDDLEMLEPLRVQVELLDGEEKEQLIRWIERQERSLLHAMDQTRNAGVDIPPYWQ